MRLIFFTLALCCALSLAAQQCPNPGFELGASAYDATDWNSINDLLVVPGLHGFERIDDAYSGQNAAQLVSLSEFGMVVPGVLSLGQIGMGDVSGGIPFAFRPAFAEAWYKHPTQGNAAVHMILTRYQNGVRDTVGYGHFSPLKGKQNYTLMKMQIDYYLPDQPDTMNLVILTDNQLAGDTLVVDDLVLKYPTVIDSSDDEEQIKVFPNPSEGVFYFSKTLDSKAFVYNQQGQIVRELSIGIQSADLTGLPVSMYYLRIEGAKKMFKIIVN